VVQRAVAAGHGDRHHVLIQQRLERAATAPRTFGFAHHHTRAGLGERRAQMSQRAPIATAETVQQHAQARRGAHHDVPRALSSRARRGMTQDVARPYTL